MLKLKGNTNHPHCQQNINLAKKFSQFYSLFFNHFLKVILALNMPQIHNSRNNNNFTQKSQTTSFNHILMPANEYNFKWFLKKSASSFEAIDCDKATCKHHANKGLAQNCCPSSLEFINSHEWTACSASLLYS